MKMRRKRIESVQAVRAVDFLAIFLSHVGLTSTGAFGVSVFFILSGFCLVYVYLSGTADLDIPGGGILKGINFASRKIVKLYPLHIVTLLAVATVLSLTWIMKEQVEWQQGIYFILNLFILQAWIPTREGYFSFNAVSWYLSTAAFLYLVFPLFLSVLRKDKRKAIWITVGVVVLQVLIAVLLFRSPEVFFSDNFTKWVTYICPLYRVGDFLIGCMAGYVFLQKSISSDTDEYESKLYTAVEVAVILLVLLQIVIYTRYTFWEALKYDLYWIPVNTAFIYLFAISRGAVSRTLSRSRVLLLIGNYSPQAFLIHKIVIEFCGYIVANKAVLTIFSFLVTMLASIVYVRVEKLVVDRLAVRHS